MPYVVPGDPAGSLLYVYLALFFQILLATCSTALDNFRQDLIAHINSLS